MDCAKHFFIENKNLWFKLNTLGKNFNTPQGEQNTHQIHNKLFSLFN